MALVWEQVIIESMEPRQLGTWWAEALGWVVVDAHDDEFEIRPGPDVVPGLPFPGTRPTTTTSSCTTSASSLLLRCAVRVVETTGELNPLRTAG